MNNLTLKEKWELVCANELSKERKGHFDFATIILTPFFIILGTFIKVIFPNIHFLIIVIPFLVLFFYFHSYFKETGARIHKRRKEVLSKHSKKLSFYFILYWVISWSASFLLFYLVSR